LYEIIEGVDICVKNRCVKNERSKILISLTRICVIRGESKKFVCIFISLIQRTL